MVVRLEESKVEDERERERVSFVNCPIETE
jgi:hypothetical protein